MRMKLSCWIKAHVVQRGTHEQLLAQPGPYRDTYKIQYADFPLEELLSSAGERAEGGGRYNEHHIRHG